MAPKPLPAWYTNPPLSTESTLFAVGEGTDRRGAISDALSLMASNLSVTVASRFSSSAESRRSGGKERTSTVTRQTIQTEVKKIRITNYTLLHSLEQGFRRHLVLLKVEKKDISAGLQQEIDATFSRLADQEASLNHTDVLSQLLFYKHASETAAQKAETLLILGVLDPQFDATSYAEAQRQWERRYLDLKNRIRFTVLGNSSLAQRLVPVIRNGISAEGIRFGNPKDKYGFSVRIETQTEHTKSMGFYLARSAVELRVFDARSHAVSSRHLEFIGHSSQSASIAEEDVAIKLKKVLETEGLYGLLGLEEAAAK